MQPSTYETILYELEDGILTLTLNRTERLNAFNTQMRLDLADALDRADQDDAVRAVILTGAGRAFSAGADLSSASFAQGGGKQPPPLLEDGSIDYANDAVRDGGGRLTLRMFECLKPLIGAINGAAVGIGATMLLPLDVRIASTQARFGFVFSRRGIVPEAASSWFLPRLVGISQAMQWACSGRVFDAGEALAGGLVSQVVEPDELLATARRIARDMTAESAPVSVALTRQMMWRMLGADHPMEAHRIDSRGIFERGRSADAKEGVGAFKEKRPANFPDRVSRDMPPYFPWWKARDYG
ncbi:MAG: crotonase/enoyl-CoA hydratase family protein [Pseudomonadota bacterium]